MVKELLVGILSLFSFGQSFPEPQTAQQIITAPLPSVRTEVFIYNPEPSPSPASLPKKVKTKAVKGTQTSTSLSIQSVLEALNNYRSKNGAGTLVIDQKLQSYAQSRADYLKSFGKLDKHAGHKEFMSGGGFDELGFDAIAENQSWNFKGDAEGLIEKFYGKSAGHNKNQLNAEYTHVGIGINGVFTNIVFGGKKK